MDYKIEDRQAFTVLGVTKTFLYEDAATEIPKFWAEGLQNKAVCGTYGVNMDKSMSGKTFEYLIGDDYNGSGKVPDGLVTKTIPAYTWAIFSCKGAMPHAMQDVNQKIFSEWLPNCKDYEFAAGYCIEFYSDPVDFKNGVQDEQYYSEIWIPVKKK